MAKKTKQKRTKSDDGTGDQSPVVGGPQSFQRLQPPLSAGVLDYIQKQRFTRMTPVQAATIPQFLAHKDVAVQACTGSGKTLAFLIPVVEFVCKRKFQKQQIGALILSPTRELALQTHTVASDLCACCNLPEPLLLVGGSSSSSSSKSAGTYRPVTEDLKSFQQKKSLVVVGTPGRVEDVLTRYAVLDCSELEYLILDEADVLLNMGFANTLQQILSRLPKMRRTGLFSATTNTSTNSSLKEWMVRAGLRNPVWIDVAVTSKQNNEASEQKGLTALAGSRRAGLSSQQQATPTSLTNYYIVTAMDEKLSRLAAFLQDHRDEKMIVFFLTCACVDFYGSALKQLLPNNNIELLHGKMVQKRREKTMERFRQTEKSDGSNVEPSSKGGALLCTDVAARGLDVSDVHWVVQFDAPQDPAFYVHRCGRTARAGRQGKSLLFLTRKEEAYVDLLRMRKVPLEPLPSSERCCPPDMETEEECKESDQEAQTGKGDDDTERPTGADKIIRSASSPGSTVEDILPKLRDLVLTDRDMLEKGTKAFTSYIRAYKEHHCAFIFRYASLDLGILATSFCLLRLPKMPELRDILQKHKGRLPRFKPAGPEVDIFAIAYKDKARELARQKRLKQILAAGGKNAKLIKAEQRKAEKERKQQERRQIAVEKGRNPEKKRGRQDQIRDEWDDLAKEERLHKKLRKGKITKEEFDCLMHEL